MLKLRMNSVIQQQTNNSSSNYCKMPDGTLIQWGFISFTGSSSSSVQWGSLYLMTLDSPVRFPIQFIDYPVVTVNSAGNTTSFQVTIQVGTAGIDGLQIARATQFSNSTYYLSWIAIGRWK